MFGIDDIIGGGLSFLGGMMAQDRTDDRLQAQMDFQRQMANTAWRRGMADMKAGGLNPILAYQKGPASSPTGAFAAATDIVSPAVNTAQANMKNTAEVNNMLVNNNLIKAQTAQSITNAEKAAAETKLTNAQKVRTDIENAITMHNIPEALMKGAKGQIQYDEFRENRGGFLRTLQQGVPYLQGLDPYMNSAGKIFDLFKPSGLR